MVPEYLTVVADRDYNRIGRRLFELACRVAQKQGLDIVDLRFTKDDYNRNYEAFSLLGFTAANEDPEIYCDESTESRFIRHRLKGQLCGMYALEYTMEDCPVKEMLRKVIDRAAAVLNPEN